MAGGKGKEDSRMYQRMCVGRKVKFSFGEESDIMKIGRCLDFSVSGICFLAECKLPSDKSIQLWIEGSKGEEPLHKTGKVIWQEEIKSGLFRIGVDFDSVDLLEMDRVL